MNASRGIAALCFLGCASAAAQIASAANPGAGLGAARTARSGYGDRLGATLPARLNRYRNPEYRRGNLTEWYENGSQDPEQGFTLTHRLTRPVSTVRRAGSLPLEEISYDTFLRIHPDDRERVDAIVQSLLQPESGAAT